MSSGSQGALNFFHGKDKSIKNKYPSVLNTPFLHLPSKLNHDMNVWTLLDTTYFYAALWGRSRDQ